MFSKFQRIIDGESVRKTYSLPVYQRSDGLCLRIGQVISHNGQRFAVRAILITSDLSTVTINVVPSSSGSRRRSRDDGIHQIDIYFMFSSVVF
jgi:hypothetical protein